MSETEKYKLVPVKFLTGLLALLPPPPVKIEGRGTFEYQTPKAAERLIELRCVFDAMLAASSNFPASPAVGEEELARANKFLATVRDVLSRRFPFCRDCADDGPVCPNSGLPCDLASEFANLSAILSRASTDKVRELESALREIQSLVVGDRVPNWTNNDAAYVSRGKIADICDIALCRHPEQSK